MYKKVNNVVAFPTSGPANYNCSPVISDFLEGDVVRIAQKSGLTDEVLNTLCNYFINSDNLFNSNSSEDVEPMTFSVGDIVYKIFCYYDERYLRYMPTLIEYEIEAFSFQKRTCTLEPKRVFPLCLETLLFKEDSERQVSKMRDVSCQDIFTKARLKVKLSDKTN